MKISACVDCGVEVVWAGRKRGDRCAECRRIRSISKGAEYNRQHVSPALKHGGRGQPSVEGDGYEYDVGRFVTHVRLGYTSTVDREAPVLGRGGRYRGPFVPPRDGESLRFDY